MSNLVPSTFRTASQPDSAAASSASPFSSPRPGTTPALPPSLYTDCQACRVTGTVTFSAVGVYALTVARSQAKTRVGKAVAGAAGLGAPSHELVLLQSSRLVRTDSPSCVGFLAIAAARWAAYTPPPPSGGESRLVDSSPS